MAYTFLYNIIYGHPSLYEIISKGHEGSNAHWAFFFSYLYLYKNFIFYANNNIYINNNNRNRKKS